MTTYLVTGAAGFIGAKVAELLLDDGQRVAGVDTLNDVYDVRLREWRLERLARRDGFRFHRCDITNRQGLRELVAQEDFSQVKAVIDLAARQGCDRALEALGCTSIRT